MSINKLVQNLKKSFGWDCRVCILQEKCNRKLLESCCNDCYYFAVDCEEYPEHNGFCEEFEDKNGGANG